jgi:hypothetical protein
VPPVEYQVCFVEKTLRLTPWERVTHLSGNTSDGHLWRMSYYDAIRQVEEGTALFYIQRDGIRILLTVVKNAWGYKCLRTEDDRENEVLLCLPTPPGRQT